MLSTIPEQSETWERRCGWPPQFSKCQWQKKTRWCWPEWRLFALCRNWMERSSCCSCPLIKKWKRKNYNFKINSHFHRQQFAIDFVWFVNAIGRLVTSGEKRTLENFLKQRNPHRCSMSIHWPSLQVKAPSEQVVNLINFTWGKNYRVFFLTGTPLKS